MKEQRVSSEHLKRILFSFQKGSIHYSHQFVFFFFSTHHTGVLVTKTGIKPKPSIMEAQGLNSQGSPILQLTLKTQFSPLSNIFSCPRNSSTDVICCLSWYYLYFSLIPGLERSPGEGKGDTRILQYSGLENSMDCILHGVARSQTRLSDFDLQFSLIHILRIREKNDETVFPFL